MTKEQEILAIAEDEFYRNGYQATSMVTVARRAGVTHAMVNYYFRSKEQLFLKILDSHTYSFIENLRTVMKEDGVFVQTLIDAAYVIFDTLDADRFFPLLIQDVARSAPELLERYRTPVESFLKGKVKEHSERLEEQIRQKKVQETSMKAIVENILLLVVSPFLMIPTLENICGHDKKKIDSFLSERRKEIGQLIKSRYTVSV